MVTKSVFQQVPDSCSWTRNCPTPNRSLMGSSFTLVIVVMLMMMLMSQGASCQSHHRRTYPPQSAYHLNPLSSPSSGVDAFSSFFNTHHQPSSSGSSFSSSPHHSSHLLPSPSDMYPSHHSHHFMNPYPESLSSSSSSSSPYPSSPFTSSNLPPSGFPDPRFSGNLVRNSGSPSTGPTPTSVVKHPGTCTFQRSQPACTFSLLCYLAGGLPVEGCEGDSGLTCCLLYSSTPASSSSSFQHGPAMPFAPQPAVDRLPSITPPVSSHQDHHSLLKHQQQSPYHAYPVSYPEYPQYHPDSLYPPSSSSSGPSIPVDPNPVASVSYASRPPVPASSLDASRDSRPRHPPPAASSSTASLSPSHHLRHHYPELPRSSSSSSRVIPAIQSADERQHQSREVHTYPHVLPIPASGHSTSTTIKSVTAAPVVNTPAPADAIVSTYLPQSAPSSVLPSHVSIDDSGDNAVRRTIGSASTSSDSINSLDFIERNHHARNFAGDDGTFVASF